MRSRRERRILSPPTASTKLQGRNDAAAQHFAEASRLHPRSWTIFRRAAPKSAGGTASGAEIWARVEALGDDPYHLPIDMKGITPR